MAAQDNLKAVFIEALATVKLSGEIRLVDREGNVVIHDLSVLPEQLCPITATPQVSGPGEEVYTLGFRLPIDLAMANAANDDPTGEQP